MTDKKICLITGIGPGTGTSLVERYIQGGYRVAMLARSEDRLNSLAASHEHTHAFPCDVADADALQKVVGNIKTRLGAPHTVIHNAVGGAFGSFRDIAPETLQKNFQVNTMALLHLAKLTVDDMITAGEGVILATGNTSAYRGRAQFAGFAPTKAAQRILLESIARDAGPKGVHAAYVAIDAVIDVPWAREQFSDKPDDFFAKPAEIADECFRIAHQGRSTWSSDIIIRPYCETW